MQPTKIQNGNKKGEIALLKSWQIWKFRKSRVFLIYYWL